MFNPLMTLDRVRSSHLFTSFNDIGPGKRFQWFTPFNDFGPCKRVHIGSHTLMTLDRVKGFTLVHIL